MSTVMPPRLLLSTTHLCQRRRQQEYHVGSPLASAMVCPHLPRGAFSSTPKKITAITDSASIINLILILFDRHSNLHTNHVLNSGKGSIADDAGRYWFSNRWRKENTLRSLIPCPWHVISEIWRASSMFYYTDMVPFNFPPKLSVPLHFHTITQKYEKWDVQFISE